MTKVMRRLLFPLMLMTACATPLREQSPGEKLYFALELRSEGHLVGKPKLLGESGKPLSVERRQPGARTPDYRLALMPSWQGDRYRVALEVALPGAQGHRDFELLQGEEKQLELGRAPGELQVTLLLMRVDSPEFRALMQLSDPARGPRAI